MNASILWAGSEIIPPEENKWNIIRAHRADLLTRSDWTQLPDAVLTLQEKQAWSTYRQALRDIPENFATADAVIFPETP